MNSSMMTNALMVDNSHFDDGDVVVLASIVDIMRKGERVLKLGPVFWGYSLLPSVRT
jgi:hypothetical protein